MSVSSPGVVHGALEELPALGVVGRHRPDQRELEVREALLDHAVGVDDPERVLPGVEARDLEHQRPLDVEAELVDDVGGVLRRQRHVLRRQRVDGRRHHHRVGQPVARRDVLGHVEHRQVVGLEHRQQEVEHLRVGRGEVDVAAPDPLRPVLGRVHPEGGRLRVVDDHEVVVVREAAHVHEVVPLEHRLVGVAQRARVPLERVVHLLGDVEELVAAEHDLPVGLQAGVVHQGDEAVEDLRDAPAEAGGVDVQHPLALEGPGQRPDVGHQVAGHDAVVVGQRLVADVDAADHAGTPMPCASPERVGRRVTLYPPPPCPTADRRPC